MHGVRSVEVVRALRPESDFVAEAASIEEAQALDVRGLRAIRGAVAALSALRADRIAVVTSATRALAAARLGAVGIEPPAVMVTAEEVTRGKPDPQGYLSAARRLGVDPAEALVVEDAPPGIEAGRAAGAAVVGVTSTHAKSELGAADVVIPTLEPLPSVLASSFDAADVLLANDGH
jgi:mannitol-1-/sugar-/sorbitol-6-phosphatase